MMTLMRVKKIKVIEEGVLQWCIMEKIFRIIRNIFSGNSITLSSGWKKPVGRVDVVVNDKTLILEDSGNPKWVDTAKIPVEDSKETEPLIVLTIS